MPKLNNRKIANAYFISPRGITIPVLGRHIDLIIKSPRMFGYSKDFVEKVYGFFHEKIGTESDAREFLIIELLRKKWVRVRIDKNHIINIQIGMENKRVYRNILRFIACLKTMIGARKFKNYGIRLYVNRDSLIIDCYEANTGMKQLLKEMTR